MYPVPRSADEEQPHRRLISLILECMLQMCGVLGTVPAHILISNTQMLELGMEPLQWCW